MIKSIRPKIFFVYPNQFGYHTDTYKYCEYLKDCYDIVFICFDQGFERLCFPNVNVIYIPYNTGRIRRLIQFFYCIVKLTRKEKFDLIFTVQFKFCFIIGIFARAKVKILDYRTGDLSNKTIVRFLKNRFLWFDSLFFKHISAISEGLRDILNLSRTKTLILPLGGDVFSKRVHSFDQLDLLYVGSLNQRNVERTIEGFALSLERNKSLVSSLSYTILGFGNNQDITKIKRAIDKFNLKGKIMLVGRVKYSELPEYFDACNIGVAYIPVEPWYEHQPATKTYEYLNSGLFTIATSTFENSKIINEKNGVLCDNSPESFARAIEEVYKRRAKISDKEIRESSTDFHWDNIINNILKPYFNFLLSR
jgi:glycosyltransferase involved in cell wall biosynthesis